MTMQFDPGWPDVASWDSAAGGPYHLVGRTENFVVYYHVSLGSSIGVTLARGILAKCEIDYVAVKRWFGGITPHVRPFLVYVDSGTFGAFHANCSASTIHVAAFGGGSADLVCMLLVAEVVETFSAAQTNGYNCMGSAGEGLSRVLAGERYPSEIRSYGTAKRWLDSSRPDWITRTEASDRNPISVGCATLYLNYLRYALGFSWPDIVQAPGATLAETHRLLTGRQAGAYVGFLNFIQRRFRPGVLANIRGDNPFPLPGDPSVMVARWNSQQWPPSWA